MTCMAESQHVPAPTRIGLAAAQLALIAALLWLLLTEESDATATTIDTAFVALMIAMPVALSGSYWAGRLVQRRPSQ
jgi:heme/copper-type cytochrome/quinol oxidase subunit 4